MNIKTNVRTPEETKKLLANHKSYTFSAEALFADALVCIQRLEAERDQHKRERDAAENDLYLVGSEQGTFCDICKYKGDACDKQKATEMYCWEWRGVQEVE